MPLVVSTPSTLMIRTLLFVGTLIGLLLCAAAETQPEAKSTFSKIVQKFMVQRNGEVVLDVRTSDRGRWQDELLNRATAWRTRIHPMYSGMSLFMNTTATTQFSRIAIRRSFPLTLFTWRKALCLALGRTGLSVQGNSMSNGRSGVRAALMAKTYEHTYAI